MPSISTGGAAMKAMMKQMVAASRQGIINTPNQPTYRRLLVEVTHWQKFCQLLFEPLRIAVVMEQASEQERSMEAEQDRWPIAPNNGWCNAASPSVQAS
jgi:hypothetical protein